MKNAPQMVPPGCQMEVKNRSKITLGPPLTLPDPPELPRTPPRSQLDPPRPPQDTPQRPLGPPQTPPGPQKWRPGDSKMRGFSWKWHRKPPNQQANPATHQRTNLI